MSSDDELKHLTEAAKTAHVDIVIGKIPEGALVKRSKPLTIDDLKAGADLAFARIRTKSIDGYYLIRVKIVGEDAEAELVDSHGATVAKLPAAVYERSFGEPIAAPAGTVQVGPCTFFRFDEGHSHSAGVICGKLTVIINWTD